MRVTFDAMPLLGEKLTGIGWCEVGQANAPLRNCTPKTGIKYSFFSNGEKILQGKSKAVFREENKAERVSFQRVCLQGIVISVSLALLTVFRQED